MPLINTQKMFAEALKSKFAVGAFNVNNMELLQGIIWAARDRKSPLILQISRGARKYANMRYLKALIDAAVAENPDLPIVVHLDHGDFETAMTCIDEGYTSVMYDGSHDSLEKNIEDTRKICEKAHKHKPYVCVEAELGMLGGIEEDVIGVDADQVDKFLTDPKQAKQFVKETGCDSLAVAIGTSHGAYKFKHAPKLAFDRLEEIERELNGFPIVMHGSSSVPQEFIKAVNKYAVLDMDNKKMLQTALAQGWEQMPGSMGVPEDAIAQASKMGVAKVNIDTDLRLAMTASILKVWGEGNTKLMEWITAGSKGKRPAFDFDPRMYLGPAREAIRDMVCRKMDVLGCAGKMTKVI